MWNQKSIENVKATFYNPYKTPKTPNGKLLLDLWTPSETNLDALRTLSVTIRIMKFNPARTCFSLRFTPVSNSETRQTYFSSWACSFSSGSIFSKTTENFTLATTQAAKGAAATLARLAIWMVRKNSTLRLELQITFKVHSLKSLKRGD